MENSYSKMLENIYKILSNYELKVTSDITDEFKCIICQKIMINATQALCGCHFCLSCINQSIEINKIDKCPGTSKECKLESLSNIVSDHKMNKRISKLIAKCPEEMCSYECQLCDMSEHLEICPQKPLNCPFIEHGCKSDKLPDDKMNEHLISHLVSHSRILVETINKLTSEISEIKENEKKQKDNNIKLNEEINLLNLNKLELEKTLKNINEALKDENELLKIQIKENKTNTNRMTKEINILKESFDNKINEIKEKINEEIKSNLERYCFQFPIEWKVDTLEKLPQQSPISSNFFYLSFKPYKCQLRLFLNLDEIRIYLRVYSENFTYGITWPFKANITINIFNEGTSKTMQKLTKYCEIGKPTYNSYECSDYFVFKLDDLFNKGFKLNTSCIVELSVVFFCLTILENLLSQQIL